MLLAPTHLFSYSLNTYNKIRLCRLGTFGSEVKVTLTNYNKITNFSQQNFLPLQCFSISRILNPSKNSFKHGLALESRVLVVGSSKKQKKQKQGQNLEIAFSMYSW